MKTVTVRNVIIGEGIPKIIVSVMGENIGELQIDAQQCMLAEFDILEWRVDHFNDIADFDRIRAAGREIRDIIGDRPLLFTFRTAREGGEKAVSHDYYSSLNQMIMDSGLADIVDIELGAGDKRVKEAVAYARSKNIKVILSNHDFQKTPPKEEIIARLCRMQKMGADIAKIAVMPESTGDLLTLLSATVEMSEKYADRPIITISMSKAGAVSRISGEAFGSSATFGAVDSMSAPGQMHSNDLRTILKILHK